VVDRAAARVLALLGRVQAGGRPDAALDVDAHHALAREAAGRSVVLLKNDGAVLPLAREAGIAVIGAFAAEPRYQGAGSSMVNPTRLDIAIDELRSLTTRSVSYAPGFSTAAEVADSEAQRLRAEAVAAAADADVAVVFLGLPARLESEGYDRDDIDLPAAQLAVLRAVLEVNPTTVVVLSNGGVVALPFAPTVPAIVEGWLLGQAGGGAIADVLFGVVNPSGKLTETIPLRLADTPAYLNFPGEFSRVRYGEGLFVGYRWYDARDVEVAYPFGHGLSYTTFRYGSATAAVTSEGDVEVRVTVSNTGLVAGREVVQVYSSLPAGRVQRPPRELKAFASVALDPGEEREVTLVVRREGLAYWDSRVNAWVVEGGEYVVDVAASSRDIRSSATVQIDGDQPAVPLSRSSSIGEVLADPVAGPILQAAIASMMSDAGTGAAAAMPDGVDLTRMLDSFPIGRVGLFLVGSGTDVDPAMIDALIAGSAPTADPNRRH
nr:glycoside hydrolase family 3 C-terminal domain-containing protein [Actinomycetota bacterium]